MIRATRLNGEPLVLNAELIELIESTPDTLVTLTCGTRHMVLESADELVNRIIEYRRRLMEGIAACPLARKTGTSELLNVHGN